MPTTDAPRFTSPCERAIFHGARAATTAPARVWAAAVASLLAILPLSRIEARPIDPDFWTPDGPVRAIACEGDRVYVGGQFSRIAPWTGSFVVIDSASAELSPGWPRVDGEVRACISDGAGGWYLGGTFTRIAGVERRRLAHLRVDRTLSGWNPGADGPVNALARLGDTVFIGGAFTQVGGQARGNLAAVEGVSGVLTALNPATIEFGEVLGIAVRGSTVYAGGWFTSVGGVERNHLAAFDAATGLLRAWNPNAGFSAVYAIASDGPTVYLGGTFNSIGGNPRYGLAAVDSTTGIATDWAPSGGAAVFALSLGPSSILVGGAFNFMGGQNRVGLAEVSLESGLATSWQCDTWGEIRAITRAGPVVYVGGDFTALRGVERGGIAALDASTGQVLAWNPPPANGMVLAVSEAGGMAFAGGRFASCGGVRREGVAAIDRLTGQPTAWSPDCRGYVNTVAPFGSTVFVGGGFGFIGSEARGGLAALDATDGQLLGWNAHPSLSPHAAEVRCLVLADTTLYVTGSFNGIGGQIRAGVAAVSPTTAVATPWNPQPDGPVGPIVACDSRVFIAGDFSTVGVRARRGLALVDADAGVANAWNPDLDGGVTALELDGSRLLVGGSFTTVGGQARSYAVALDTATAAPTPWYPGANNVVSELLRLDATVFAGGSFSGIGGQWRPGFSALDDVTGLALPYDPELMRTPSALATDGSSVYFGSGPLDGLGRPVPTLVRLLPAAAPPAVTALAPAAGDTLVVGGSSRLEWSATALAPGVQSVDLYVSRGGSDGPWELIAAGAPNSGQYDWFVTGPAAIGSGWLRVDARDYASSLTSDLGEGPFTILDPDHPFVIVLFQVVTTPGGARSEWRLSGEPASFTVRVERAADANGPWQPVPGAPGRDSEDWFLLDGATTSGHWWYRLVLELPDGGLITSGAAEADFSGLVPAFALSPLSPNPTQGTGQLTYAAPRRAHVRLSLFDLQGREVAVLLDREVEAGTGVAAIDARELPAGLYFVRLRSGGVTLSRRIVLAP